MTEGAPRPDEETAERVTAVAHELRAPLTVIRGYLQMLARRDLSEAERRTACAAAERAARRMETLLDDLVAAVSDPELFSPVVTRPVSMLEVASDVVEEARALAGRKISVSGEDGMVRGDPARLRQALENLVSNAVKHTPDDGRIDVVVTETDEGVVQVVVEDSGPGIPDEAKEVVFDLFERLGAGPEATSGLGLGLPIARAIVRAHGGEIVLAEPGQGKGARFVVTLPAAANASAD